MRFYTINAQLKRWYLTVIYRDESTPTRIRVGDALLLVGGKGTGTVKPFQMECYDEHHSVEIYPPAKVFAIICSDTPGIDPEFLNSLAPRDEAELIDPRRVVGVEKGMAFSRGLINGS